MPSEGWVCQIVSIFGMANYFDFAFWVHVAHLQRRAIFIKFVYEIKAERLINHMCNYLIRYGRWVRFTKLPSMNYLLGIFVVSKSITFVSDVCHCGLIVVNMNVKYECVNPESKLHGANMGPTWVLSAHRWAPTLLSGSFHRLRVFRWLLSPPSPKIKKSKIK